MRLKFLKVSFTFASPLLVSKSGLFAFFCFFAVVFGIIFDLVRRYACFLITVEPKMLWLVALGSYIVMSPKLRVTGICDGLSFSIIESSFSATSGAGS